MTISPTTSKEQQSTRASQIKKGTTYSTKTFKDTPSVAMAQANVFAILGNKIVKNLKIFVEVDYLRSRGVLCQP